MFSSFFPLDYGYGIIDKKDLPRGPKLKHEPENIIVRIITIHEHLRTHKDFKGNRIMNG